MTDIRTSALKTPVDVAQYLFTRLHQMGVRSVHGVPGDYNLVALDYMDKTGLKWVGSVNELNAGRCSLLPCPLHVPLACVCCDT
jgi:pyruvate decarboxylase